MMEENELAEESYLVQTFLAPVNDDIFQALQRYTEAALNDHLVFYKAHLSQLIDEQLTGYVLRLHFFARPDNEDNSSIFETLKCLQAKYFGQLNIALERQQVFNEVHTARRQPQYIGKTQFSRIFS